MRLSSTSLLRKLVLLIPSRRLESRATKLFEISASVIVSLRMSLVVIVLSWISLLSTVPFVILSPLIFVIEAPFQAKLAAVRDPFALLKTKSLFVVPWFARIIRFLGFVSVVIDEI